ncbi:hypothetical protein Tco_1510267, partial [Tanacetum coccineum]
RKIPESPWGSPIPIGDADRDANRFPDGDGDGDGDEAEKRGWGWLDHKAINTRRFNLEKHVMVVEGEKKKKVKFASKIHMKYINPINEP